MKHVKSPSSRPFYTLYLQQRRLKPLQIQNPITNPITNLNTSFVTSLNTS